MTERCWQHCSHVWLLQGMVTPVPEPRAVPHGIRCPGSTPGLGAWWDGEGLLLAAQRKLILQAWHNSCFRLWPEGKNWRNV